MRKRTRSAVARPVALGAALLLGVLVTSCQREPTAPATGAAPALSAAVQAGQGLARAVQAKEKYVSTLMARSDVAGVAVGLTQDGRPAVLVLASVTPGPGMPHTLDGVPVRVEVTGPIRAIPTTAAAGLGPAARGGNSGNHGGPNSGGTSVSTTSLWPRPVPIGISTGNVGECEAGTISARVTGSSGNTYALSNNHVYALENTAPLHSTIVQPGLYDTNCVYSSQDNLGTLSAFTTISFTSDDSVDAAIALTSTSDLGNATPSNGYGAPSSTTMPATLNMLVQKYGRTTQLTHGQVTGIDATISVGYSAGTATFVHQIIVQSAKKAFIKAGDSGSLLVTDDSNDNPVGLLFAGDQSGKLAVANRIGDVLRSFGVTIDGK